MKLAPVAAVLLGLAQAANSQDYTPAEFENVLREVEASIDRDSKSAAKGLPPRWRVKTPDGNYFVPSAPLVEQLRNPDGASARMWISQLRAHLQRSGGGRPVSDAEDREFLSAILKRPEFAANKPPNALQRAWERMQEAFASWIRGLLEFVAAHPTGSKVLFWSLISLAVVALLAFLLRVWMRGDAIPALPHAMGTEVRLRPWQDFVREAREAVSNGDYAQAVRCAYWAGVARLLEDRPARIRFTDTPRERLRSLEQPHRNSAPLPAQQMEPLKLLTGRLERHWYAKQQTSEQDAQQAFKDLEALGCKLD